MVFFVKLAVSQNEKVRGVFSEKHRGDLLNSHCPCFTKGNENEIASPSARNDTVVFIRFPDSDTILLQEVEDLQ